MANERIKAVVPVTSPEEKIRCVMHYPDSHMEIHVGVGETQPDGSFIFTIPQQFTVVYVRDVDYTELLSANPVWAVGKPAGTFRQEDLWAFIDTVMVPKNLGHVRLGDDNNA